mmetsp:Transcript_18397/g.29937  ORF Transcript_18397/g.29937 Transcript_18397/m.29937 type:complete len:192 (-) Transcript_18397:45-620(-)
MGCFSSTNLTIIFGSLCSIAAFVASIASWLTIPEDSAVENFGYGSLYSILRVRLLFERVFQTPAPFTWVYMVILCSLGAVVTATVANVFATAYKKSWWDPRWVICSILYGASGTSSILAVGCWMLVGTEQWFKLSSGLSLLGMGVILQTVSFLFSLPALMMSVKAGRSVAPGEHADIEAKVNVVDTEAVQV